MEEIIIKNLESKPTVKGDLIVVTFNGNRTASIAPWEKEIAEYVKQIGIGGSVSVTIEEKNGYTNITAVDMTSGKSNPVLGGKPERVEETINCSLSQRDANITAQCLTKCWASAPEGCKPEAVLEAYVFFLRNLQ